MKYIFTEVFFYFRVSELFVDDPTKSVERIPISIDVSLPKMKCDCMHEIYFLRKKNIFCIYFQYAFIDIGLDIQDDMGRHEVGYVDSVIKDPLNDGEGCRFQAKFQVNKVSVSTKDYSKVQQILKA